MMSTSQGSGRRTVRGSLWSDASCRVETLKSSLCLVFLFETSYELDVLLLGVSFAHTLVLVPGVPFVFTLEVQCTGTFCVNIANTSLLEEAIELHGD